MRRFVLRPPGFRRTGTTLIETAVVLGVLTMGTALTIPALSRARQDEHMVGCAANLGILRARS